MSRMGGEVREMLIEAPSGLVCFQKRPNPRPETLIHPKPEYTVRIGTDLLCSEATSLGTLQLESEPVPSLPQDPLPQELILPIDDRAMEW